jgi:acetolactate synthase-1/2/3 large subunit
MSDEGLDRRSFLKSAAAISTSIAAASTVAAETTKKSSAALPGEKIIGRPGSDFMVDVIKATGIEYIASNPASSFRSLHESIVNYGGNRKPEFLTCMHEESSVAMAHGYAKAAGKPMGVLAHGTVGLQHAAMAVYNAWCDRVPVMLFAGNFMDAAHRRPGVEWYHCAQDPAGILRDYIKWDDQPASLQHFAESVMRGYKFATTPPMEPVLITADGMLQEHAIEDEAKLVIPKLTLTVPPQGEAGALKEAAKMLVGAEHVVIVADRAARTQEGIRRLVELAEALNAPVVDLGGRMNFPTTHYLCRSEDGRALVRDADVVLMLEVADPWGQLNTISDPQHQYRRLAKPDVKMIHVTLADNLMKSNYQDAQRFCPCDLSISGDVEATLPALTEAVRKETTGSRKSALAGRSEQLRSQHREMKNRTRAAAANGWDATPVSTARLSAELWNAVKNEKWCLAESRLTTWSARLWPATEHYNFLGHAGAAGVGYTAPAAVGAALANRDKGILTAVIQPDGDLMYAPGVLWTAAHHKIPILMLMHNNRAYHQEVMHLQKMAGLHNRRMDTARIGTTIENPNIDYALLARAQGVWAEGPITDPAAIAPALQRAMAVVKRGEPALVDVVTQGR